MLFSLSGALAEADTESPHWTAMDARERRREKGEREASVCKRTEEVGGGELAEVEYSHLKEWEGGKDAVRMENGRAV